MNSTQPTEQKKLNTDSKKHVEWQDINLVCVCIAPTFALKICATTRCPKIMLQASKQIGSLHKTTRLN
uniref:Uncharacterized protein n=1 Tax=Arundo donax TaxID=35708 RepID=A0A0A8ZMS3_ARUDO